MSFTFSEVATSFHRFSVCLRHILLFDRWLLLYNYPIKIGLRLCFKEQKKKKEGSVKNSCVGGWKVWRHWVLMMCSGARTDCTVCKQMYVEFPWNDTWRFEWVQRFTGSTFLFILTALYEYIVSWYAPCWANPDSHCLWIIEHPGRRDWRERRRDAPKHVDAKQIQISCRCLHLDFMRLLHVSHGANEPWRFLSLSTCLHCLLPAHALS